MNSRYRGQEIDLWSADELREFLEKNHPDDYQLIDVRHLPRYEEEHLPGSVWVSPEDLSVKLKTLDKNETTILYCDKGTLSRTAAWILMNAGFEDVHVLQGGLTAWHYGLSKGLPSQVYSFFLEADTAEERAEMAWALEDATGRFYESLAQRISEPGVTDLLIQLAEEEHRHKKTLQAIWEALTGQPALEDFPKTKSSPGNLTESGLKLEEIIQWAEKSSTREVLDFAMAMELYAYDYYLNMYRMAKDPDSQRLFEVMADEERHHLKSLGTALEQLRGPALSKDSSKFHRFVES